MFELIKHGHVFIVLTALLLFWLPLLSTKGGDFHRGAGKVFLAFMSIAGVSGGWLALTYLWTPGKWVDGCFLLYALFVLFSVCFNGIRALHGKHDKGLDVAVIVGGVAALALGLKTGDIYLIGVGPLGMALSGRHLFFKGERMNEHLGGMIGTGIAGYTALIFFELSRYFPAEWGTGTKVAVWLAPAILGGTTIALLLGPLSPKRR